MTTVSAQRRDAHQGKGSLPHAPDTGTATTDRATPLLDLDGTRPPGPPGGLPAVRLTAKVSPSIAAWVDVEAARAGLTVNAWLKRLINEARRTDPVLPADCRLWLQEQAAQCGCPGDPDRALVLVLRHLAARWPNGARLNP